VDADIVVRGQGRATALPDRATVRAVVDATAAGRDEAYGEAAVLARQVDEVVAAHAEAIDRSSVAALVVQPTTRWRKGESIRTGWQAIRTTVLDVVDLSVLGDLIAALSGAGAALSGPDWQLDPTNSVHGEARRLAAEDARRRADDYAAALGLRVTSVAWIAEPGLHDGGGIGPQPRALFAMSAEAAEDEVIDVTPEEVAVTASVEVGFSFDR
jgi:uncharacterized protein YggE